MGVTVRKRTCLNRRERPMPKMRPTEIETMPSSRNWPRIRKGVYQ